MKYINKYTDLTAYTADTNRPTESKTVSKIADTLRFEGKNIVVDKAYCNVGDTVVFDKNDSLNKVVKLDTLNLATLGSNFDIKGTIGLRTEDVGLVVANQYSSTSSQYGAPYKVKVVGFDFATGGSFTITVNTTTTGTITYATSDTLATVATSIMAALTTAGFTAATGWSCTAYTAYNCIVVQQNYYTPNVTIFLINDADNKVSRTILTGNYQTALSGVITPYGYIHRIDGVDTSSAITNLEKGLSYYSVSGQDLANQSVGASTIIKESRFNLTDNPLLVAYYVTYRSYIQAKMPKYPYSRGVIISDSGQSDTIALAARMYTDYDGTQKPGNTAAYSAFTYGVNTAGYTTGFEANKWWMLSPRMSNIIMGNVTYGLVGVTAATADPLNRGINAAGGALISVSHYLLTSAEFSSNGAWIYYGSYGTMGAYYKVSTYSVRPVTAISLI